MGPRTTWNVGCLDRSRTQESATNHSCRGSSLGVYTGGQTLEKPSKLPFLPLLARPARRPGAKARSASRSVRSISDLSWVFLGLRIPRGYRCTETATPISAPCSLSRAERTFLAVDFRPGCCVVQATSLSTAFAASQEWPQIVDRREERRCRDRSRAGNGRRSRKRSPDPVPRTSDR